MSFGVWGWFELLWCGWFEFGFDDFGFEWLAFGVTDLVCKLLWCGAW